VAVVEVRLSQLLDVARKERLVVDVLLRMVDGPRGDPAQQLVAERLIVVRAQFLFDAFHQIDVRVFVLAGDRVEDSLLFHPVRDVGHVAIKESEMAMLVDQAAGSTELALHDVEPPLVHDLDESAVVAIGTVGLLFQELVVVAITKLGKTGQERHRRDAWLLEISGSVEEEHSNLTRRGAVDAFVVRRSTSLQLDLLDAAGEDLPLIGFETCRHEPVRQKVRLFQRRQ